MTIRVACAADRAYTPHAAAMMHSVLAHAGGEEVAFHHLHGPELPRRFRRRLERMVGDARATIEFHEITDRMVSGLPARGRITVASWYRLFVADLVDADRVLFLDADAIVLDDVRPLYDTELGGAYVAGVEDPIALGRKYMAVLGLPTSQGYFNAGVLILDLRAMQRDGKGAELVNEARRLAPWLFQRDQDVLNVVLGERRLRLHPRWNVTPAVMSSSISGLLFDEAQAEDARERPAIRHFFGPRKPWSDDRRPPHADAYWEHRRATPF